MTVTDYLTAAPWDLDARPEDVIRSIANDVQRMINAGELDTLPRDTKRRIAAWPMPLMNAAGDVRLIRDEGSRDLGTVVADIVRRAAR